MPRKKTKVKSKAKPTKTVVVGNKTIQLNKPRSHRIIDIPKMLDLATRGVKDYELSKYFRVSQQAIINTWKYLGISKEERREFLQWRQYPREKMEALRSRIAQKLTDDDIKKMSGHQKIVDIGILSDKIIQEKNQGKPTIVNLISIITQANRQMRGEEKVDDGEVIDITGETED